MLKKTIVILCLFSLTLLASAPKESKTITTERSLEKEKSFLSALKKADKEKKPVLFIISRHTCKYCVVLDKEVLANEEIIKELNKNFITTIAYTDDGARFPQKYNTGVTPTIWFLSHNGKPLFQPYRGAMELKSFKSALNQVKKEYTTVSQKKDPHAGHDHSKHKH